MNHPHHPVVAVPATRDDDRGSAAAYLVIMAVALLALAGLVFDGGRALAARGHAASLAEQAARVGADTLTARSIRDGEAPIVDPNAAAAAAHAVLSAAGADGTVTVTADSVQVSVHETRPATILSLIGIATVGGSATATAVPLRGITEGH